MRCSSESDEPDRCRRSASSSSGRHREFVAFSKAQQVHARSLKNLTPSACVELGQDADARRAASQRHECRFRIHWPVPIAFSGRPDGRPPPPPDRARIRGRSAQEFVAAGGIQAQVGFRQPGCAARRDFAPGAFGAIPALPAHGTGSASAAIASPSQIPPATGTISGAMSLPPSRGRLKS